MQVTGEVHGLDLDKLSIFILSIKKIKDSSFIDNFDKNDKNHNLGFVCAKVTYFQGIYTNINYLCFSDSFLTGEKHLWGKNYLLFKQHSIEI